MGRDRVFNSQNRRVLRKRIPYYETLSSGILLGVLLIVGVWFFAQKNNYDPSTRDISMAQLLQGANDEILYNQPLKRWVEPGTATSPQPASIAPFPNSIIEGNWAPSASIRQFQSDNLFEKINGEAEKFIKQGFQELYYLSLKSGTNELSIELFDQGNLQGSLGIFADHLSEEKMIEESGPVTFFLTSVGVIGRKGRFFFRVAGNDANEDIQTKSLQLVTSFSELNEKEGEVPREFLILNAGLGIAAKTISYQNANVFQYDFAQGFWFGQMPEVPSAKVFIHREASSEELQSLFGMIVEEQSYDYDVVEESRTQVTMFHNFLKNYFVIGQQGKFLFGVENLEDPSQIAAIMEKLSGEINNG